MFKKESFQYLIVALVALLSTLPWLGYMAGDTVIHLVFAENAVAGNWFYFNPLTPSGGESSPLYLVFVTALYKLAGPEKIPYLLIACNVVAWLATALLTRRAALLLGINPLNSTLCALAVAAMPGSVRNAVLGMENVYLALLLLVFLNLSIPLKWLSQRQPLRVELLFGLLFGAMACLRSEATILVAVFALARHAILFKKHGFSLREHLAPALSPLLAAALYLLQLAWYYHATHGQFPFAGGLARQALAAQEAWFHLGPVPFNGKILTRFAAYFPLTFLALSALLARGKSASHVWIYTLALGVAVMIPLFATVLPSGHLGRYTIFLWPPVALMAAFGWQNVVGKKLRAAKYIGLLSVAGLFAIYGVETILRYKTLAPGHALAEISAAPSQRTAFTRQKLEEWGLSARPKVNVAVNEVQLRYFVDNRIQIISLDGIVNDNLRHYIYADHYDHLHYLADERADILLEFPNFNADPSAWSLASVQKLEEGQYLSFPPLIFSKLPDGAVRISYLAGDGE